LLPKCGWRAGHDSYCGTGLSPVPCSTQNAGDWSPRAFLRFLGSCLLAVWHAVVMAQVVIAPNFKREGPLIPFAEPQEALGRARSINRDQPVGHYTAVDRQDRPFHALDALRPVALVEVLNERAGPVRGEPLRRG